MNVSYKWLKEYVDFNLTPEELAAALTSIGLEVGGVEEVQSIRGGLKGIVVGEVLTCEPHPDSDHMHVCSVRLGTDESETTQIVCGAPNVAAGQKVMVATLGTVLYDGDKEFQIKKSKLRGVESFGMICAEDEIGVGTSHDGIIVLPSDAKVGTPAAEYYGLESDYLVEVDITPNHSDACSHWGVARDLYAWLRRNGYEAKLQRPSVDAFAVDNHDLEIKVSVENAEACPHYCAVTVKGCEVKESPEWLKQRLETIGLRPINNIVDITNYIMMAFGQPLHCFDADIVGKEIVVTTLPEGTKFETLDGVERTLSERDLMICRRDEKGEAVPMCIGGVYGGRGSGTYDTTRDVCFESAYFHPTWIRKSARRHQLQTDASFRFERGIDPAGQLYALKLAAMMAKELAGGTISMEIQDIWARELPQHFDVDLKYQYCDDLIGKHLPQEVVKSICEDLGMKATPIADGLHLEVPAFRVDVQRPCDVVEEILRIYGYNNIEIPSRMNACLTVQGETDRSQKLQTLVGEQLVGQGFHEILNNSLTKEAYYADLKTYKQETLVRLVNPLSADLNVLRQTLLFGGLETIARNVNRRAQNLRLFEVGKHYRQTGEATYAEEYHLGLWLTGNRVEGSWAHADEKASVFELKAYAYDVLQRVGLPMGGLLTEDSDNDIFSHGLTLKDRNGKVVLEFGLVAKKVCALCGVEQDVYYADLHWDEIMRKTRKNKVEFSELSKFPAVSRDLALLVDNAVRFADIESLARQTEKKLLKRVVLFDVYEGKNLPAGKKSYAVNFILQDETKTMNDKQVEAIMQKIINQLTNKLGAQLR